MNVTYKYALEAAPSVKKLEDFLSDFFKEHFNEFLNSKKMILISPDLGDKKTLLYFDIDYKLNETNEPDRFANQLFKSLNLAFKPFEFNLEITPHGCHIVSNFYYDRMLSSMVDTKKQLQDFFKRIRNLDLKGSFCSTPLRRIGFDTTVGFFFHPVDKVDSSTRNKSFSIRNPYDLSFWKEYIQKNLISQKHMSFETLKNKLNIFKNSGE